MLINKLWYIYRYIYLQMSRLNQLSRYRKHLEERYNTLVERSNDYKYIDEIKSDRAAYKAMKILGKLNKVNYLNNEFSKTISQ